MRLGICGRWYCWRIHVSIVVQKYVAMMTRVVEWYMERTSNGGVDVLWRKNVLRYGLSMQMCNEGR